MENGIRKNRYVLLDGQHRLLAAERYNEALGQQQKPTHSLWDGRWAALVYVNLTPEQRVYLAEERNNSPAALPNDLGTKLSGLTRLLAAKPTIKTPEIAAYIRITSNTTNSASHYKTVASFPGTGIFSHPGLTSSEPLPFASQQELNAHRNGVHGLKVGKDLKWGRAITFQKNNPVYIAISDLNLKIFQIRELFEDDKIKISNWYKFYTALPFLYTAENCFKALTYFLNTVKTYRENPSIPKDKIVDFAKKFLLKHEYWLEFLINIHKIFSEDTVSEFGLPTGQ